jgi:tRNA 2-thiouridine synthesizing protein A
MSRLSEGEREFISDFGELPAPGVQPTTTPATPPALSGSHEMDARGISAPLPLLRAYRALRTLQLGEEIRVITSYPGSLAEFQALARHVTSFDLVSQDIVGEEYVHVLRRRR